MDKPRIVAKVGNLKQDGWIDIFADDWYITSVWGKANVRYIGNDPVLSATYIIDTGNAYIHVDAIKRRVSATEPIREELDLVKL